MTVSTKVSHREAYGIACLILRLSLVFPLNCTIKWRSADGKLMSPHVNEGLEGWIVS